MLTRQGHPSPNSLTGGSRHSAMLFLIEIESFRISYLYEEKCSVEKVRTFDNRCRLILFFEIKRNCSALLDSISDLQREHGRSDHTNTDSPDHERALQRAPGSVRDCVAPSARYPHGHENASYLVMEIINRQGSLQTSSSEHLAEPPKQQPAPNIPWNARRIGGSECRRAKVEGGGRHKAKQSSAPVASTAYVRREHVPLPSFGSKYDFAHGCEALNGRED